MSSEMSFCGGSISNTKRVATGNFCCPHADTHARVTERNYKSYSRPKQNLTVSNFLEDLEAGNLDNKRARSFVFSISIPPKPSVVSHLHCPDPTRSLKITDFSHSFVDAPVTLHR